MHALLTQAALRVCTPALISSASVHAAPFSRCAAPSHLAKHAGMSCPHQQWQVRVCACVRA